MQKKKMMILVALMLGTITWVGIPLAMDNKNGAQQHGPRVNNNKPRNGVVLPLNPGRESDSPVQGYSRPAESQGIEGRVIDLNGNPAAGVEVIGMRSVKGPMLRAKTDEKGNFSFEGINVGTYEVFFKAKDGPICPSCLFYSGGTLQPQVNVHVLERHVTSGVVIQMTPEWAKISGSIVDIEKNSEPIVTSRITLRRVDNPHYYFETGPDEKGNFTIPVPPVPITIEVSAEGYKTWTYSKSGTSNRSDPLKVISGKTKSLIVSLRHEN